MTHVARSALPSHNRRVSDTRTCDLCGTVNLQTAVRCIACGSSFPDAAPPVASPNDQQSSRRQRAPAEDLDSSAQQETVLEQVPDDLAAVIEEKRRERARERDQDRIRRDAPEPTLIEHAGTASHRMSDDDSVQFVTRLLMPDGDRRTIEVGARPIALGSGIDSLGVTGDPRVLPTEGHIFVEHGALVVQPGVEATGVYRRVRDEEVLQADDVILMGDVAAMYTGVAAAPPVDGSRQVLGGSANTPCGRLTFLRRDGSAGPVHDLPAGKTIIGRTDGHLNFPHDARLSRRHVRFFASDRGVSVEDLGSRNGTYLRVRGRSELEIGDALRIGSAGLQIRGRA